MAGRSIAADYPDVAREQFDRFYRGQQPHDLADPMRFGQASEGAVDALIAELRAYFTWGAFAPTLAAEAPTIRKYLTRTVGEQVYETSVRILKADPGVSEQLPHILVSVTSDEGQPFSIGPPLVGLVQFMPRLRTRPGPFDLSRGGVLALRSHPPSVQRLRRGPIISELEIRPNRFPTPTAVTALELAEELNALMLYFRASAVPPDPPEPPIPAPEPPSPPTMVEIAVGGMRGEGTPNFIEIAPGTTPLVRTALGLGLIDGELVEVAQDLVRPRMIARVRFGAEAQAAALAAGPTGLVGRSMVFGTGPSYPNEGTFTVTAAAEDVGSPGYWMLGYENRYGRSEQMERPVRVFLPERDDHRNLLRPPMMRSVTRDAIGLKVEVVTDDEQTRNELTDLVKTFVTFYWGRTFFALYGRGADPSSRAAAAREHWDVVYQPSVHASRSTVERPGERVNKIWVGQLDVNVTLHHYLDREILVDGTEQGWFIEDADLSYAGSDGLAHST